MYSCTEILHDITLKFYVHDHNNLHVSQMQQPVSVDVSMESALPPASAFVIWAGRELHVIQVVENKF